MEHRVSSSQLEDLLDHLTNHPGLVKGVGLGARSKAAIDKQWDELAAKLNAHGSGATKSGQRWKRYWADIKHKTKSRAAAKRRDASGTGGGPSTQEDLSETDIKILAIIGEAAIFGDVQHRVPVFEIHKEPQQLVSTHGLSSEDTVDKIEPEIVPDSGFIIDTSTIVNSPSKSGPTSKLCNLTPEYSDIEVITVPTEASPKGPRRPLKRSLFKGNNNKATNNPNKVNPDWIIDLESRRIAAEEKLADAALIIAEAARTNAETARTNAETARLQTECTKMHFEILLKLIERK